LNARDPSPPAGGSG